MKEYGKINTVWKRDSSTSRDVIIPGEWATEEFKYLRHSRWDFYEKIDGANIRLMWNDRKVQIRGKTDDAQIPEALTDVLNFDELAERFDAGFDGDPIPDGFNVGGNEVRICLYGEGTGARVHQGGGRYGDPKFVLFDVAVRDQQKPSHWWWLDYKNVRDVASKMGVEYAPQIGAGSLHDMAKLVEAGFNSNWGDFKAEGIVARPGVQLWNRRGERIIAKLKMKDYHDLRLHREGTVQ